LTPFFIVVEWDINILLCFHHHGFLHHGYFHHHNHRESPPRLLLLKLLLSPSGLAQIVNYNCVLEQLHRSIHQSLLSFIIICHFNKTESFTSSSKFISNNLYRINCTISLKRLSLSCFLNYWMGFPTKIFIILFIYYYTNIAILFYNTPVYKFL
jgi:hypothetical protein